MFFEKRCEVRGAVTEQGTEKGIGDDTFRGVHGHQDYTSDNEDDICTYPYVLFFPGILHILYNALQEAIEADPRSAAFIEELRVVERFLHNKPLRLAFITHCLEPAEQGAFKYFSTTHIDWRWEFLEKALNKLVPLLHILFMRFDVGAIQRTVGTVVMDSILSPVATLIATNPHFDTACELYRVVGTTIEHYAKKLEGCWCHENIWKQSKGYKRRRQELETHTGNRRCVWKGRMGPWWVAAGIRLMLAELARCSSDALANAIARAPPDVASRIMQSLKTTRARIIEILEAKLDFFLPHTVSGNRDLLGRVRW